MALSKKRQAFVEVYLTCWNAAEAARAADYSEKTARQQGSRLLTNVDVQAAIAQRLAELKIHADEVLVRLTEHARGSMADFLVIPDKGDAKLDLKAAAKKGKLHLVKKFKRTTGEHGTSIEFELYDAQAALNTLARHHKLLTDKVELTDWRKEAEALGVDPDALREGMVEQVMQRLKAEETSPLTPPSLRLGDREGSDNGS